MQINKFYNENCLDTMAKMPNEFIDLTITSPPYDNLRNYNGYSFDFEKTAIELFRVTKRGGVVVWIVGDKTNNGSESGTSFKQCLFFKEIGFNIHDTMIYQKDSISFPETTRYNQIFEYMFILSKGKIKTFNPIKDRKNLHYNGTKIITGRERQSNGILVKKRKGNLLKQYGLRFNIWKYSTGFNKSSKDKIAFDHPAIFPERLVNDHIISWSNKGDLVFDPFLGSGTTSKMCILNDRNWIGSEISEKYCEIIDKRNKNAMHQFKIFS